MNLRNLSGNSRRIKDASSRGVKLPTSNLYFYGTKYDINGNRCAVFSFGANSRKWLVQIDAYNLDAGGLRLSSNAKPEDIIPNTSDAAMLESNVINYINDFGSSKLKDQLYIYDSVMDSRRVSDARSIKDADLFGVVRNFMAYKPYENLKDEFVFSKYDLHSSPFHLRQVLKEINKLVKKYNFSYKFVNGDTLNYECFLYDQEGTKAATIFFYIIEPVDESFVNELNESALSYVSDSRRVSDSVDFITLFERLERAFGGCDANRNVAKVYVNNQIINVELSVDQVAYIYTNSARTADDVVDVDRSEFVDDDSFINAVIDNVRSIGAYGR